MSIYADFIVSTDEHKNLFKKMINSEIVINLENWHYRNWTPHNEKLRVAHMPSNRSKKNTDIILNTLRELESEELIEINLIENIPHSMVKSYLKESDVFIDQFTLGFGKSSIEAMALGLPVLVGVDNEITGARKNAPVLQVTNLNDLKDKLKYLSKNREGNMLRNIMKEVMFRNKWLMYLQTP